MIVVIVGELDSGKSTMLAGFVSRFASESKVVDNDSISEELLSDIVNEGERVCIALDEKYRWYDSRMHMSGNNRLFAAAVSKVKAAEGHVFIAAQEFSLVDKRVRHMTDFIIRCERIENEDRG